MSRQGRARPACGAGAPTHDAASSRLPLREPEIKVIALFGCSNESKGAQGMQGRRKTFRIEAVNGYRATKASGADHNVAALHNEIMTELKTLRSIIEPKEAVSERMIEAYKNEIAEAHKLKAELDLIYDAINKTKHEIATVHVSGFEGPEMARVTHELDAIVGGTAQATDRILSAAEFIDQSANTLSASLRAEHEQALTQDIRERVIEMFEACNFHDLTGQRVGKVVATLKFIEQHIVRMMDIWGGIESFKDLRPEAMAERAGERKLLNGPRLETDIGHASQDEIDALFA
jgi:chemotaxis protein CheZ